jgi:hypothetical protein
MTLTPVRPSAGALRSWRRICCLLLQLTGLCSCQPVATPAAPCPCLANSVEPVPLHAYHWSSVGVNASRCILYLLSIIQKLISTFRMKLIPKLIKNSDHGFESQQGLGISLFTTASRTALGPTQPPLQWVPWGLSPGVKRPGREADHSPPSSAEVKECVELYLYSLSTPSWRGAQLKKHRDFTFTFTFTNTHRSSDIK